MSESYLGSRGLAIALADMRQQTRRAFETFHEEGTIELMNATYWYLLGKTPLKSNHPKVLKFNSLMIYHMNRLMYNCPAQPFNTIPVDASEVEFATPLRYDRGLGRITGGDWDRQENLTSIDGITEFASLRERFERGIAWERTDYIKKVEEIIQTNGRYRGYPSVGKFINERCAYVDELYEDIKNNGYRSETRNSDGPGTSQHDLEPVVAISRGGDILFTTSGKHRFCMAKILNLQIPCHVVTRHETWQRYRDDLSQSETATLRSKSHPDLQDILSSDSPT